MSLELLPFTDNEEREWDDFVRNSINGTIFHLRKFLKYHPAGRFEDASLRITRNGELIAVFPAALIEKKGELIFQSHPGASFGGLVVSERLTLKDVVNITGKLISHAETIHSRRMLLTIPPDYYSTGQSDNFPFALQSEGFVYRVRELSSVLSLDISCDAILKQFPESLKRALRKADRSGLSIGESDAIDSFYSLLQNNLGMRHNIAPTHSLAELKHLFELFPTDIKLYSAERQGEMLGGIVTFRCNSRVNLAFYIAHDHDYQTYRTVDSLMWHVIQESKKNGYSHLDFGTFTLNGDPNWGLCRFKEKFGARGVFRDTFERRI